MALKITYWTASANPNLAGSVISSETVAASITSTQSGVTPSNASYVSISAIAVPMAFDYSSANPTALAAASGASAYLGADKTAWLDAKPGFKIAGIEAS